MSTNMGSIDRILRIVIGIALILLALGYLPGFTRSAYGWIGLIPLGTALIGWCPAYSLLGVNTCGRKT